MMRRMDARGRSAGDGNTPGKSRGRRPPFRLLVAAAGIAAAAAAFFWEDCPRMGAISTPPGASAPVKEKPPRAGIGMESTQRPGRRAEALPMAMRRSLENKGGAPAVIGRALAIERKLARLFQYQDLDCQMLPAGEARRYAESGAFDRSPREAAIRILYDKTDVWNVLAAVRYLDSLNLESRSGTLYEEYSQMWLAGGSGTELPDPRCIARVASAVSLLQMARSDLSALLAEDPSYAEEVLSSLSPPMKRIVLSGAVGASLADPRRPTIEGLFDFLPADEKLALIDMYDSALPPGERIQGVSPAGLRSLPDSELWRLFTDRVRRFNEYSQERERIADEARNTGD